MDIYYTSFIFLLFSILTMLASALHGANTFSKGIILPIHSLFVAILGVWLEYLHSPSSFADYNYYYLFVYFLPAIYWWFLMRGGDQARAELDYQGAANKKGLIRVGYVYWAAYLAVFGAAFLISYWLLVLIPLIALSVMITSKSFSIKTKIGKKLVDLTHLSWVGILPPDIKRKIKKYVPIKFIRNTIIKSWKTPRNLDNFFGNRSAVEAITGFFPGGIVVFILSLCSVLYKKDVVNFIVQTVNSIKQVI